LRVGQAVFRRPSLFAAAIAAICLQGASSAVAQTGANRPVVAPSGYTINPGDQLEIYVWGEERLQRELRVLPDGTIAFPLVGQLNVQGMAPQAVERLLGERLKGQYRGDVPNVTVSVKVPAGLQVSVMGKVRSPGAFTPGRYVNVLDALSLAGGPAEFANLDNVTIIRRQGDRLVTLRARLSPLFRSGASTDDADRANIVPLVPGDTVIVP
jgi:polysaccharide biosynthesis/export protein